MRICIESHRTLDFPGGSGLPMPPPMDRHIILTRFTSYLPIQIANLRPLLHGRASMMVCVSFLVVLKNYNQIKTSTSIPDIISGLKQSLF